MRNLNSMTADMSTCSSDDEPLLLNPEGSLKSKCLVRAKSVRSRLCIFPRRGFVILAVILAAISGFILVREYHLSETFTPRLLNETEKVSVRKVEPDGYVAMKSAMDTRHDPCHDFYKYANGNWPKHAKGIISPFSQMSRINTKQLETKFMIASPDDSNPPLVNEAIKLFKRCIDITNSDQKYDIAVTSAKKTLKEFGGWPFLGDDYWDEKAYSWETFVAHMMKMGFFPLFEWSTFINAFNSSETLMYFKGGTHSESLSTAKNQKDLREILKVLRQNPLSEPQFKKDMENLAKLQYKVNKLTTIRTLGRIGYFTIEKLQNLVPGIDWLKLVEIFTSNNFHDKTHVDKKFKIAIRNRRALKHLLKMIKSSNKRNVANLLGWNVAKQVYDTETMRKGKTTTAKCFALVKSDVGHALNYLYVRMHPNAMQQDHPKEIIRYVLKAMEKLVNATSKEMEWMDPQTQAVASKKIREMHDVLWYDDFYSKREKFDKIYGTVTIVKDDDFFKTWRNLKDFMTSTTIHDVFHEVPVKYKKMKFDFWTVNAFYLSNYNLFFVPLGDRMRPLYFASGPQYLNFGSFAFVVGHEIGHAFDPNSRNLDEKGQSVRQESWSEEAKNIYDEKMQCIDNQFSRFKSPDGKYSVDGKKVLTNSKSDLMGLRAAIAAYDQYLGDYGIGESRLKDLPDLTPYQVFYLAFAQIFATGYSITHQVKISSTHPPNYYRVIGTLQNDQHFAKVWNCKKGSRMNPPNKCFIW